MKTNYVKNILDAGRARKEERANTKLMRERNARVEILRQAGKLKK